MSDSSLEVLTSCFRASRKIMRSLGHGKHNEPAGNAQQSNDIVRQHIESDKPCMIARFGYVELEVVCTYLIMRQPQWQKKLTMFYRGGRLGWDKQLRNSFCNNAGFFPATGSNLERYAQQVLDEIPFLDVLHSWLPGEKNLSGIFSDKTTFTNNYHPYLCDRPWMEALKGKKVLVISPFSETIKSQYRKNRKRIYSNPAMLPDFDLITLQAVQSAAGIESTSGFDNWFTAFDYMCNEIQKTDFDIALIGAGSYGFSLSSYIKKNKRKAVHTAGGTQLLFGIKGKRWEDMPEVKNLFNEFWVRPSAQETPKNALKIEAGCYW